jgi:uncharacterized membrane protein YeaQ/YmgE (transglycosylase-associated protein family)
MTVVELIVLLLVAGILGVVSQRITGIEPGGLIMSVVLGFIGAWLGRGFSVWLSIRDLIYLDIAGSRFPLLWSILGGVVVTTIVGWLQWHGRRKRAQKKK